MLDWAVPEAALPACRRRVASGFFSRRTRAQNPEVVAQFVPAFPARTPRVP
jgi:hypothetical protein